MHKFAQAFANGLRLHQVDDRHADTDSALPVSFSLLHCDQQEINVSAVKKAEKSDDLIVRVFNITGKSVQGTMTFSDHVQSVHMSNLLEETLEPIELDNQSITLDFKPHQIITLRLGMA